MGLRSGARVSWAFKREIKGPTYKALLHYALRHCNEGLIIIRPQLSLSQDARRFLLGLEPFRIPGHNKYPWLGAQLFDAKAEVWRFHFHSETLAMLLGVSSRLYQWEQPHLPEDLSLFRSDGSDWLVTMAHNRTGYLSLSREEHAALSLEIPKLPITKG